MYKKFASGMHYIRPNFISRMYVTKEQNADLYADDTSSLLLWISIYFVSSNDDNNEDMILSQCCLVY